MKNLIIVILLCMACMQVKAQVFTSGADVSWCTEMEASGKKFYTASGKETDIFALMKELGMTAIRLRVWVNPKDYGYGAWCDKADVLAKAKRAHSQGLDLLIDFHYSDSFTDPEKQNIPKEWEGYTTQQVKTAMANHTKDVLQALKDEGIEPKWVQVGNETNSGIVMMYGKIDWSKSGAARFTGYTELSNAGYDAVKEIFPNASVIVHLGGTENANWFFTDFKASGGKFDMIGLSHYPTEAEWNSTATNATHSNINAEKCVSDAAVKFNVPVMICETGFDVNKPTLASEVMIDLFNRIKNIPKCSGIFYWEPEVDGQWKPTFYDKLGWGAYGMGAFTTDGKPTKTLDAFGGKTLVDKTYPAFLKIYDKNYQNILATLMPVNGKQGIFFTQLNATESWMNFTIADTENNIWYGTDPSDKTTLSAAVGKWNCWIDSDVKGIYDVEVNLSTMKWKHALNTDVAGIITPTADSDFPTLWYDIYCRKVDSPTHGFYIMKKGRTVKKVFFR